jgi:hypothetical protein
MNSTDIPVLHIQSRIPFILLCYILNINDIILFQIIKILLLFIIFISFIFIILYIHLLRFMIKIIEIMNI